MRYLLSLLVLFVVACTNDLTLPSDDAPKAPEAPTATGFAPVTFTPSKLVSCTGLPNVGSIVKVNSYPATYTSTGNVFTVTGDIVRDDASWPGVQNYCNDTNASMKWQTFTEGAPYCLTQIEQWPDGNKYAYELQHTCATGPTRRAIAIPYNAAGTTVLSTKRDTTVVFP